ncbi:hypothetical protein [Sandaracinus amylolyticus]|uniref:hypothetical protein n=1 Tax=Sandaracinus amylolyticus TaxID=927083 RepID=UPI001F3D6495|nr:hypothetical protein [Sandaracinus amylolyticus]UJR85273.1 Hypothetical protein I5071_73530 [Sandaracinus amylolyticus]
MGEPIDDARIARRVFALRRSTFACVALIAGAIVPDAILPSAGRYEWPACIADACAWAVGCTTAALAWWAVGRRRDVGHAAGLCAIAGGVSSPLSIAVIGLADVVMGTDVLHLGEWPVLWTLFLSAPIGALLGAAGAFAFALLGWTLERTVEVTTITSEPRAALVAATWCVLFASLVAWIGEDLDGTREAAIGLVVIAGMVALAASVEIARRRKLVRDVERHAERGWTIEAEADGSRWLVRETHSGDGPHRASVVRVRWGRLDR